MSHKFLPCLRPDKRESLAIPFIIARLCCIHLFNACRITIYRQYTYGFIFRILTCILFLICRGKQGNYDSEERNNTKQFDREIFHSSYALINICMTWFLRHVPLSGTSTRASFRRECGRMVAHSDRLVNPFFSISELKWSIMRFMRSRCTAEETHTGRHFKTATVTFSASKILTRSIELARGE